MKLKSNLRKNLALGLTLMVAAGSVVPNVAIAKSKEVKTTIESVKLNEYEGKELVTTIYDKNNKKIIDVKMLVKGGKVIAPYLKGIEIKSVNVSKNGKFAVVLNTDDPSVIQKLLKAVEAFYGKERTVMSSYDMDGDIYETEMVQDNEGNIVSQKETKKTNNPLENLNTEFLNNEEANKIADTLKELIEKNKQREAEEFLENLNLNPLDKEIMGSIADEFKKMAEENKKIEESQEIYDKIKKKLAGDDKVNDLVGKIQSILETKKEREFLESLNLGSIDKKVSSEMADIFKQYLDEKKDSIEEYNKIREKLKDPDLSFTEKLKLTFKEAELRDKISKDLYGQIKEKLTEDDYSNIVNLINELNNNVKEREEKEKESKSEYDKIKEQLEKVESPENVKKLLEEFNKNIEKRKELKEESEKTYKNIKEKLEEKDYSSVINLIKEFEKNIEEREKAKKESEDAYKKIKENLLDNDYLKVKDSLDKIMDDINKKEQASQDVYDKIKKNLIPEDEATKTLADKIKELEKEADERKFLEGLNLGVLNPDVTSNIKDIFNKMVEDNKRKEESEDEYNKIKDKLNPEDEAIDDLAKKIKDLKQEAEEREFLENLNLGVINPGVSSDIKDMFNKMIEENERIAAEERAKKESEDLYNKIKENLNPEDKETKDLAEKIKDLEYDTRAKKFNNQRGINFELLREKFIEKINKERATQGAAPLVLDKRLQKGAEIRANELASINHIRTGPKNDKKHKRLDGESSFRTAFDYMPDYNYNKAGYLGENLVGTWIEGNEYGHYLGEPADQSLFDEEKVAEDLFQKWKKSPGHYRNFMNKSYKTMWLEARLGEAKFDPEYNAEYGMLVGVQILSVKSEEDYKRMEEEAKLNSVDGEPAEEIKNETPENKEQPADESNKSKDAKNSESSKQDKAKADADDKSVVQEDKTSDTPEVENIEVNNESKDSMEQVGTSADESSADESTEKETDNDIKSDVNNSADNIAPMADSQANDTQDNAPAETQSDASSNASESVDLTTNE